MKYILLFLLPSSLIAQTINVDSLERRGYHVYVHKKHTLPKVIIKRDTVRDTVWKERIVRHRDTVQIYSYSERSIAPHYVLLHTPEVQGAAERDQFTLAFVGTGNTNGYELHFGSTLAIGRWLSFFIGGGCAYNSVLKQTRLDLGGHLIIALN